MCVCVCVQAVRGQLSGCSFSYVGPGYHIHSQVVSTISHCVFPLIVQFFPIHVFFTKFILTTDKSPILPFVFQMTDTYIAWHPGNTLYADENRRAFLIYHFAGESHSLCGSKNSGKN